MRDPTAAVYVPPETPNEQLGQNCPGLHPDRRGVGGHRQDVEEHDDQGAATWRPSATVVPKFIFDSDQFDEGPAQHTVQSMGPRGGCQCRLPVPERVWRSWGEWYRPSTSEHWSSSAPSVEIVCIPHSPLSCWNVILIVATGSQVQLEAGKLSASGDGDKTLT